MLIVESTADVFCEIRYSILKEIRRKAEELWLRAIRLYTFNTPVGKGKYRLYRFALGICRYPPDSIKARVKDGRLFWIDLTTQMQESVFFLGEHERVISQIAGLLIKKGDVCLDVGANYGWYTTLFPRYCGETGSVHSFEPVPATFNELRRNFELIGEPKNIFINNLALGDKNETVTINLFEDLPTGHASLSTQERDDVKSFQCEMVTLDSYLTKHGLDQVDFIKVDIEGAEMMFLRGAEKLFTQAEPPVLLMEMALHQTRSFGYTPNDLLNFIRERAAYDFYAVDELHGKLQKIEGFDTDDIGANVFCIPSGFDQDRVDSIVSQFK